MVGRGFTVWEVNECTIRFRHSNFEVGENAGHCNLYNNDRGIVGHWREKYNLNITTELTIPANLTLAGMDVNCTYDDGLNQMLIGTYTISFTSGNVMMHVSGHAGSLRL